MPLGHNAPNDGTPTPALLRGRGRSLELHQGRRAPARRPALPEPAEQRLEDEIGVDLMKRSPRGVTLTAEGKLFLDEARQVIARTEESVNKVRALARGEYGELH